MYYIPRPLAQNMQDALDHIAKIDTGINTNESINWAITLTGEDKLLGIICFVRISKEHFRSEIGYMLHPDMHNKGIMNEAIKKVIEYGFNEMKLHSIEAVIDAENTSSIKLAERNNFVKEGHFKERDFYHGKFNDIVVYSLLKN